MDYTSRNHSKYLIMVHLILEKHFWNERTLWGDGYFACSIGNVSKEIIEKYIQSQG